MNLKKGDIISGDFWPEPIKIDLIEEYEDYINIIGAYVRSKERVTRSIDYSDLSNLKIIES
ncbi:MAG TPA: hypothetical protein PKI46_07820, partial [Bacteroidales bacterium]|nr:hypothetical protein [Bacteroidales bacterium]